MQPLPKNGGVHVAHFGINASTMHLLASSFRCLPRSLSPKSPRSRQHWAYPTERWFALSVLGFPGSNGPAPVPVPVSFVLGPVLFPLVLRPCSPVLGPIKKVDPMLTATSNQCQNQWLKPREPPTSSAGSRSGRSPQKVPAALLAATSLLSQALCKLLAQGSWGKNFLL